MSTTHELQTLIKNKAVIVIALVAVIAGLLIGMIIGGASAESSAKGAAATPKPAVTITATPAAAETVTKVPEQCTDALDDADKGFKLAADGFQAFQDAITAIQSGDLDGVNSATDDLKSVNGSIESLTPEYQQHKAACQILAQASK